MKIFNKLTKRYINFKTAKAKGLFTNPENFSLPSNIIIRKDTQRIISAKNAQKLISSKKLYPENLILGHKVLFNQETKRFIGDTKKNKEKISKQEDKKEKLINQIKKNFEDKKEFTVSLNNKIITDVELFDIVAKRREDYTLLIGNQYYVLNDNTRNRLRELVKDYLVYEVDENKSDGDLIVNLENVSEIKFVPFVPDNKYKKDKGAFFKYVNLTDIDFTRYGIFIEIDKKNYEDTCLIYALRMGGLEEDKIEKIKLMVKNRIIPKSDFEKLCEVIQSKIILKIEDNDQSVNRKTFGKKYDRTFNIGLLDEHYFIIDKTDITSYALQNYFELKDEDDFNYITGIQKQNYFNKDKNRVIDSFDAIKILLENKNKLIEEISYDCIELIGDTPFYDSVSKEIINLHYDEGFCVRGIKPNTKAINRESKYDYKNVFFDFETFIRIKENKKIHIPYLCRTYDGINSNVFYGENCGLKMLRSLKSDTRLIAHNATYDFRFIIHHLYRINEISRGTRLIGSNVKFGNLNLQIKDSYHLIDMPLRDFSKNFGLDKEKEIMPYDLYTEENINKRFISVDEALQFVDEKEKEQFLNNLKKWKLLRDDNTYDIIEYSSIYCELDCKVLHDGYKKFQIMMTKCTNLDMDYFLTNASIVQNYLITKGCYEGVYELAGTPQKFIQRCIVGGRTMTSENKKIIVEERINDFDAVSLYPSAMFRMKGFLKGKPKVIINLNYEWLSCQDGYFVDIIILNVGIKRKFPLMSIKNKEGVRIFNNDMIGKIISIDKTSLEDLIEFQKVEFEVIRGYYFDEGFNTKIKEVINFLFEERLRYKKENNDIQLIYKLLMNSSYGKTIMKEVETENKFFDNEKDFNTYLSRNYNWVKSFVKFGTKIKVEKIKTIDDHQNLCHIGCSILSMSKRIMNEVMCLAEDNGVDIYYQDTDSMHLKDKDIKLLTDKFKEKYDRDLEGKMMGQFHSDFELKDSNDKKCKDVIAVRSIFLGKKSYVDELEGINDKGEKLIGYHVRMKSIPSKTLEFTCKDLKYKNMYDMYLDLYNNVKIECDLTNDGKRANFKMNKDYSVNTLSYFIRTLQF
jgi:hypothetical protein